MTHIYLTSVPTENLPSLTYIHSDLHCLSPLLSVFVLVTLALRPSSTILWQLVLVDHCRLLSLREHSTTSILPAMTMDSKWSPDYCLACDRQTSGGAYCSQACRLAELETSYGSEPSSPTTSSLPPFWASVNQSSGSGFYLQPAFDFAAYRPSSVSPSQAALREASAAQMPRFTSSFQTVTPSVPFSSTTRALTPSSSRSSLSSISSNSSTSGCLSAQALSELRSYSNSFDVIRNWKRRMNSI